MDSDGNFQCLHQCQCLSLQEQRHPRPEDREDDRTAMPQSSIRNLSAGRAIDEWQQRRYRRKRRPDQRNRRPRPPEHAAGQQTRPGTNLQHEETSGARGSKGRRRRRRWRNKGRQIQKGNRRRNLLLPGHPDACGHEILEGLQAERRGNIGIRRHFRHQRDRKGRQGLGGPRVLCLGPRQAGRGPGPADGGQRPQKAGLPAGRILELHRTRRSRRRGRKRRAHAIPKGQEPSPGIYHPGRRALGGHGGDRQHLQAGRPADGPPAAAGGQV
mmetsp:Transcript_33066/g.69107  ORF Transcript_33066/g.69107 Transcript_33066/m.69107 type:complete len:270 (-) Transcript_33066:3084-3893(-)